MQLISRSISFHSEYNNIIVVCIIELAALGILTE